MSLGLNHCSKSLIVTSSGIVCSKTFFFANWEEEVSCCMKSCVSWGEPGVTSTYRNPLQLRLLKKVVKLVPGSFNLLSVSRIHHVTVEAEEQRHLLALNDTYTINGSLGHRWTDASYPHNRVDSPTVTFPHASEARLTTDVPDLRAAEEMSQRRTGVTALGAGLSASHVHVICSIVIYQADIPLLSRCLWSPSAC